MQKGRSGWRGGVRFDVNQELNLLLNAQKSRKGGGGCEPRIEVIVKMKNKSREGFRVTVKEELK